jgi:hypothetical protein
MDGCGQRIPKNSQLGIQSLFGRNARTNLLRTEHGTMFYLNVKYHFTVKYSSALTSFFYVFTTVGIRTFTIDYIAYGCEEITEML